MVPLPFFTTPPPRHRKPASARCIWYLRRTFASSRRIFGSSDLMFVWWNGGRKVDLFTSFHPQKKLSNWWIWCDYESKNCQFFDSSSQIHQLWLVMMNINDTFQWLTKFVMWFFVTHWLDSHQILGASSLEESEESEFEPSNFAYILMTLQ
jgi:hypothetical protein